MQKKTHAKRNILQKLLESLLCQQNDSNAWFPRRSLNSKHLDQCIGRGHQRLRRMTLNGGGRRMMGSPGFVFVSGTNPFGNSIVKWCKRQVMWRNSSIFAKLSPMQRRFPVIDMELITAWHSLSSWATLTFPVAYRPKYRIRCKVEFTGKYEKVEREKEDKPKKRDRDEKPT